MINFNQLYPKEYTMRTNFEPMTKRDTVATEQATEWKARRDHMKKLHKTQRGTSQKREWN